MKTKKEQLIELVNKKVKQVIEEVKKKQVKKLKKSKKKPTLEGITVESQGTVQKDDLGRFYVVSNPSKDSVDENLVFETDLFNFTEKVQNGSIRYENIRGIFKKQESANRLKERLVRERTKSIMDAKNQAEKTKALKDEVNMKTNALHQAASATKEAISKLNENKKKK